MNMGGWYLRKELSSEGGASMSTLHVVNFFNAVRGKEGKQIEYRDGSLALPYFVILGPPFRYPNWRRPFVCDPKMDTSLNSKESHGTLDCNYMKRLGNHESVKI